ncbi:MAG TPA: ABC-2 family transporter protein, partial [Kofleriaceae bacterium]|nr:ABC-2 family transporter protein [Kofleriaceae bacterium]
MTRARSTIPRSLRIAALQLRLAATSGMAYRADFLLEGAMALVWIALTLLPWFVLFEGRPTVAGWDRPSALIVMAYFTAVRAVLEGLISPSFVDLVEKVRTGTLDYVLLKPVDAQVMISSSRCEPWKVFDLLFALGLVVYAFAERGAAPGPGDAALGVALFVAGLLAMYALWVLCAAASFWVVRLDNLTFLLGAIFDVARWPVQVFRGVWRLVFTFIIPVAVMTTFPAMALLGELDARTALATVGGALALLAGSR